MRALRLTALAVLLFTIAGCGADEQARTGGGAEVVPAEAPVFVAIDSDLSSDQWQQADELLHKFPGRAQLLSSIRSSLNEDSGLDYEQDVDPALGDEIDLVWLDFANDGSNVVGVTKPKDKDAFRQMIEKGNKTGSDKLVYVEVDGWFVVADEQTKLDRFEQEMDGAKLADDAMYKDSLAELPEESLVSVYAKGESITRALQDVFQEYQGGGGGASPFQLTTGQRLDFITAALAAEGDGVRLAGAIRAAEEPKTEPKVYSSKLIEDAPGDAIAFLTFRGDDSFVRQAQASPTYRRTLRQFQQMFGLRLDELLAVFRGEVALYVRPAIPLPQFTLLVSEASDSDVLSVNEFFKALASTESAKPCPPTTEDGITVRCVDFGEIDLRYAVVDGKLVVTTGPNPVAELQSSGTKLADSEAYKDAVEAAGMPDETAGLLWLDLAKAVPMLLGFADASDEPVPPDVRANLEPLKSFLVWGDADGRTSSFSAFLAID